MSASKPVLLTIAHKSTSWYMICLSEHSLRRTDHQMSTKTAAGSGTKPSLAAAMQRLKENPAIDLADFAVITGIGVSTAQRQAAQDRLPVPVVRIGQRWIIPTPAVRKMMQVDGAA